MPRLVARERILGIRYDYTSGVAVRLSLAHTAKRIQLMTISGAAFLKLVDYSARPRLRGAFY